jgi:hypothetical protein
MAPRAMWAKCASSLKTPSEMRFPSREIAGWLRGLEPVTLSSTICRPPAATRNDGELRHGGFSVAQPVAQETGIPARCDTAEPTLIDSDLATISAAGPTLPAAIRAGIVAMVKAVGR